MLDAGRRGGSYVADSEDLAAALRDLAEKMRRDPPHPDALLTLVEAAAYCRKTPQALRTA